jgi:hypothetical protein
MDSVLFCIFSCLPGSIDIIVLNGGLLSCGLSGSHHPDPVGLVVDTVVIQRRRIVAIRATSAKHQRSKQQ